VSDFKLVHFNLGIRTAISQKVRSARVRQPATVFFRRSQRAASGLAIPEQSTCSAAMHKPPSFALPSINKPSLRDRIHRYSDTIDLQTAHTEKYK